MTDTIIHVGDIGTIFEVTIVEKDGVTPVYMQTDLVTMDSEDTNGNWGFQVQKLPSDKWKELGSDKAKEIKLPYLGNLKIFAKKTTDAIEAIPMDSEESEDLPF